MPAGIWALQWANACSQRRYPITADSAVTDTSGAFILPDEFVLGLYLPISAGANTDPASFFLYQVGSFSNGWQITVGYQPADGAAIPVASAFIAASTHTPGTIYALGGFGPLADSIGQIVIGRTTAIEQQPAGLFTFTLATAHIEPDCIWPIIRGISSISIVNGSETSSPLTGDIEFVADNNMQITPVIISGQNPQIRFSAISGEGLAAPCVCSGEDVGPPISRIDGVPGTPSGDFTLLGSQCLQITPITNGLQITDICSQPCCGCSELETITAQLEQMGTQVNTVQGFVTDLQAQVTTMSMTVLGSRLSDQSCAVGCTERSF